MSPIFQNPGPDLLPRATVCFSNDMHNIVRPISPYGMRVSEILNHRNYLTTANWSSAPMCLQAALGPPGFLISNGPGRLAPNIDYPFPNHVSIHDLMKMWTLQSHLQHAQNSLRKVKRDEI